VSHQNGNSDNKGSGIIHGRRRELHTFVVLENFTLVEKVKNKGFLVGKNGNRSIGSVKNQNRM
jgi:hypothetical protein